MSARGAQRVTLLSVRPVAVQSGGCRNSHPTCNKDFVRANNDINNQTQQPQLVNPAGGNFRCAASGWARLGVAGGRARCRCRQVPPRLPNCHWAAGPARMHVRGCTSLPSPVPLPAAACCAQPDARLASFLLQAVDDPQVGAVGTWRAQHAGRQPHQHHSV